VSAPRVMFWRHTGSRRGSCECSAAPSLLCVREAHVKTIQKTRVRNGYSRIFKNIPGYSIISKDIQGHSRISKAIQGYSGIFKDIQGYPRIF